MGKLRFQPNRFSDDSDRESSVSTYVDQPIITKGKKGKKEEMKINIDVLNDLISSLRDHAHLKLDHLKGPMKKNFAKFEGLIKGIYKTPAYSHILDMIHQHFRDIDEITPGTIGSYCYGNKFETKFDGDSACASIAIGSIPLDNQSNTYCRYPAVLAEYRNKGYTFTLLRGSDLHNNSDSNDSEESHYSNESRYNTMDKANKDDDSDESSYHTYDSRQSKGSSNSDIAKGFVFIPHESIEEFHGFTRREKRMLSRFGIDQVVLYSYSTDGKYHSKLMETHIDQIKSRKSMGRTRRKKSSSGLDGYPWLLIFVILIIVFVGGFLLSNKLRYNRL